MEKYRALCGAQGASFLHQTSLDSDDVQRLPSQAANAATRVFLLKADELEKLANASKDMIRDRGSKNPAKPLAHYLPGKAGLVRLRANYEDPGQTERGVRALLKSAPACSEGAILFVGVGSALFEQIWSRAGRRSAVNPATAPGEDGSESPQLRALVDQNPNLQVPEALAQTYLGSSSASDWIRRLIVLAAKVNHPVLIQGDTGTGKEVVARMIHRFGSRSSR